MTPKHKLCEAMSEYGLTMDWTFIPFRGDRKERRLQWDITLYHRSAPRIGDDTLPNDVIVTRYEAGIGHCPSYPAYGGVPTVAQDSAIDFEVTTGYQARPPHGGGAGDRFERGARIDPDVAEVMHSLLLDAEAIDHASFEAWAEEFGYNTDSRAAERTYKACLRIGLAIRAAVGDEALRALRSAAEGM
jgi:hypothetical protein